MMFSYVDSVKGSPGFPSLVIPVLEFKKGSKENPEAEREYDSLFFCIAIYTKFCGNEKSISRERYKSLCKELDNKGNIVIDYIENYQMPFARNGYFIGNVIANKILVQEIDLPFIDMVHV